MAIDIRHILVPTDFSACAQTALAQAAGLARHHGATLHLLHVMMSFEEDPYSLVYQVSDRSTIYEQQSELCREAIRELLQKIDTKGIAVEEHRVRAFTIAPTILELVDSLGIDLVVMGGHGRRGLRRWLLGSVAEEMVRTAPCPVMTVRETTAPINFPPRRIVVPVDFSPHAKLALDTARRLAGPGTRIDLVHVVENPVMPHPYEPLYREGQHYGFPEIAQQVELAMADFVADPGSPEVVCQVEVLEGKPAETIAKYAETSAADLVVLATHGLTGLDRLLMGSVSERVVRSASCPVLTLKDQAAFELEALNA